MILALPLHDGWTFRHADSARNYPAQVPGCIHTDLLHNQLIPDPFWGANELDLQWIEERNWSYSLKFRVEASLLKRERVELVCEGLDTLATLVLNGHEIARTENMFVGYRFEIKELLRQGENELQIHFASPMPLIRERQKAHPGDEWNDPTGGSSNIRKEQCSFGWDWGPRFATCGIYLPIRLESWNSNRIESVHLAQKHEANRVFLSLRPALSQEAPDAHFRVQLRLNGSTLLETESLQFEVPSPQLWWCYGLGEQPLYELSVELMSGDEVIDTWQKRIGLRTVELDRHADEWGESFQFVVNGVPIFAKGANWIPAHAFVTEAKREDYAGLLQSATDAHMNMIRVWGGGIYEMEDFYDLCDQKGLLVWQDFAFACGTYPGDEAFLNSVREEADYQVERLQHRACIALWCGNNEIEEGFRKTILSTPERKRAYQAIFDEVLPAAVEKFDGTRAYWPSSPHHPAGLDVEMNHETGGDTHYWDVWHSRAPVKNYEKTNFRFCSEFGMQSYSSPEVAAQFCEPSQMNVFSPAMENHQKNPAGNQIILDYISRQYRFPKDYASLAYLSQLNQAFTLKVGIEHFRRSMPRTMGALYWQLNDCWPVFSWSSLEFGGKWKALHFEAKRFFAPALISLFVPGDETAGISNRITSTIHDVHIFTVYDGLGDKSGTIFWELRHLDGRILESGSKAVELRYGESINQKSLDFAGAMSQYGAKTLYVRAWLEIGGKVVSRQTAFLTARRFLEMPRAAIESQIQARGGSEYFFTFTSPVFQTQVQFELEGLSYRASDNFFDLYPDVPHLVTVQLKNEFSPAEVAQRLSTMSLADSYQS
ncbi:beta-mannosidase [Abditibacterium utsteinense]|uniref:Beta-mannosidase B n=1 Tax=Abditibacterium utsteinense TaxID=1960156 RepID=A0A2S8SRX4_9BACT|nr:glycoside hydrolase family 2 protein [Abditibacterium utsteinense]PQV63526.1 beta-mannosidase [Abditibacterium utsteinense]